MANRQAKFDLRNQINISKYKALKQARLHKQLVPVSKRKAKQGKQSCHKARAWRCKGTFAVAGSRVKASKIDWI